MNADFVDTNIVIYCVSDDEAKRSKAQALLARRPTLSALNIVKRYHCSIYDSLIIAAALSANCTTLYSEIGRASCRERVCQYV